MTDLVKLLSVFARTKQDYYSFSDDDSYGNVTNYVIIIQDGIILQVQQFHPHLYQALIVF